MFETLILDSNTDDTYCNRNALPTPWNTCLVPFPPLTTIRPCFCCTRNDFTTQSPGGDPPAGNSEGGLRGQEGGG